MTPITRIETFLAKICGEDVTTPTPITRLERYWDIIAGNDAPVLLPITRVEFYLAKIAGLDIAIPTPITREEFYLAAIAGAEVEYPVPVTRYEYYLVGVYDARGETPVLKTVTGALLHITDALAKPAHELVAVLSPKQDGSGDPSPTNVRPISGWTGVNVTHAGKNLFNKNDPNMIRGVFFTRNGTTSGNNNFAISYVKINPGDKLVYSGLKGANGNPCGIQFFDSNKQFLAMGNPEVQQNGACVTAPSGAAYIGITVFYTNNAIYKDIDTAQLEIGTVPTEYEAYHANTLPINWQDTAGTIYGGTLTLNEDGSADLQPEYVLFQIDSSFGMPTSNITERNGYYYRQGTFASNLSGLPNRAITSDWLCNKGKAATRLPAVGDTDAMYIYSTGVYYYVSIRADLLAEGTNEAFYNYLDSEKPIFCMHVDMARATLNIPQPYHFDNVGQLMLFLGENNIWVDASDDLTLTYYADGNVSDEEALNTLLGGMYSPGGDVSDREALNILLGN